MEKLKREYPTSIMLEETLRQRVDQSLDGMTVGELKAVKKAMMSMQHAVGLWVSKIVGDRIKDY